ncbi:hypothetical protein HU200_027900 [Digitaria exilis]|uniref:F-box domain-containing protein n=1 Tax=Digitaria exilis TaxID=1010633 RepID=A0A835C0N1_9POAL|nr:hypothetical protein HU200_027900 [Digitaria exilis]
MAAVHRVPELVDDAVEEVLIRCLPDDPARLHRAALVCKRWRRLVSSPAFRRRYTERHHRAFHHPLGFVCNFTTAVSSSFSGDDNGGADDHTAHFVPSPLSSFHLPAAAAAAGHRKMRALDARYGRVLLHDMDVDPISLDKMRLVVWNPITGEHRDLPRLPLVAYYSYYSPSCWNAAVLCAAAGDGGCDHVSCHRGHFRVVVVGVNRRHNYAYSCVYSSEPSDTWPWRARTTCSMALHPGCRFDPNPSALVGDALYFVLQTNGDSSKILKYDLATERMSAVNLPPPTGFHSPRIAVLTMDEGGLGLAIVGQSSKIYMWSRVNGSDGGTEEWCQSGVIDLEKFLPANALVFDSPALVGFAGVGVIFIGTKVGNFVVDLKSDQVRKLDEGTMFYSVFPFSSSFRFPGPRY